MSLDLYLKIDTGGEYPATVAEVGNITHNVGAMWVRALGEGICDMEGRNAGELIPVLRKGIADMEDHPADYRKLNPANGWGNYEGALEYLRRFLQACIKHPKAFVYASC